MLATRSKYQLKRFGFIDSDILTVSDAWTGQIIGINKDLQIADINNPENDAVFMMLVLRDIPGPLAGLSVVIWYNGEDHYFARVTGELTTRDKITIDNKLKRVKFGEVAESG